MVKKILTKCTGIKKGLPSRWKKIYKGKTYYLRGDYETVLKMWEKKKVQLDNGIDVDALPPLLQSEVDRITALISDPEARVQVMTALKLDREQLRMELVRLASNATRIDTSDMDPNEMSYAEYKAECQPDTQEAYRRKHPEPSQQEKDKQDKQRYDQLLADKLEDPDSIAYHVQDFLAQKKVAIAAGELKPASWSNIRLKLKWFVYWAQDKKLEGITSKTLIDFHAYLCEQINCQKISRPFGRDIMRDVGQFLKNRYNQNYINELPRNLGDKSLSIRVPKKKLVLFTDGEIKTLLAEAKERLKLCILLSLNCGMTQKDISDLRPDQVDWANGRIIRNGSKTVDEENVPEVSYKLWDSTFSLLKKYGSRTGEMVLSNTNGTPLQHIRLDGEKLKKSDCIKNDYSRLNILLEIKNPKQYKSLRKTASSKLYEQYPHFAQYFLGQSPRGIVESHYVKPSKEQFDIALAWMEKEWIKGLLPSSITQI